MELNGDGRAEYLKVNDDGSVECWLSAGGTDNGPNVAKVTWIPQGNIASGVGKDGAGLQFADLNGMDALSISTSTPTAVSNVG